MGGPVKPDWERLIKAHADPISREGVQPGKLLTLKRGIVAMSIKTRTMGSSRSPRGQGIPFLFHRAATPKGIIPIEIDLSHDDFLIFCKNETYAIDGKLHLAVHKHCIPWDNISEIEFIERAVVVGRKR
jgi:hypothetical protein